MLTELRRLQTLLGRREYRRQPRPPLNIIDNTPRDFKDIFQILKNYGIFFDTRKRTAIISKDYGDFIVNLLDGTVKYSPLVCLKCVDLKTCTKTKRKLSIVGDSEGWANFTFSKIDMLILSKIFALIYEQLPTHVLKQIQSKSFCMNEESKIMKMGMCKMAEESK